MVDWSAPQRHGSYSFRAIDSHPWLPKSKSRSRCRNPEPGDDWVILKMSGLPHIEFWPFLGRPLKDVMVNFGHFRAPSLVTLLTFKNVINPKHLNT